MSKLIKYINCKSFKYKNLKYALKSQKHCKQIGVKNLRVKSKLRVIKNKLRKNKFHLFTYKVARIHFHYVRYADDFLVGVKADKSITKTVQQNISLFLKNTLHLRTSNEYFKHINNDKIKWLGFLLSFH